MWTKSVNMFFLVFPNKDVTTIVFSVVTRHRYINLYLTQNLCLCSNDNSCQSSYGILSVNYGYHGVL